MTRQRRAVAAKSLALEARQHCHEIGLLDDPAAILLDNLGAVAVPINLKGITPCTLAVDSSVIRLPLELTTVVLCVGSLLIVDVVCILVLDVIPPIPMSRRPLLLFQHALDIHPHIGGLVGVGFD